MSGDKRANKPKFEDQSITFVPDDKDGDVF